MRKLAITEADDRDQRPFHKPYPLASLNTKNLQRMLLAAMRLVGLVVSLCLLAFGLTPNTWAQSAVPDISPGHQLPSPTAVAVRTDEPITLDAVFDERSWDLAPSITEFRQRDPHEGEPASEQTEVRILFDTHYIYLAVKCFDSNPSSIVATELRRDAEMEGDDMFEVMFDTFHDHRNGYRFRVNALGTLRDQLINDEGRVVNDNWDEKWNARARITEEGWVAEIAIPFRAMRFNPDDVSVWGMNMHRTIMRKNEEDFWSGYKRGYTLTRISGGGHLQGLSDIEGLHVRIKPFVATRADDVPAAGNDSRAYKGKLGLEDAKFLLSPQLVLDLTANPDFAQAEVDQAQVNLSRFNLFFPEKREFFQEGAGIFQFGTGSRFGSSTDFLLFHSRRIGLSANREEIPILGGLKLTGKAGRLDIGLMNMQTDHQGAQAGQNFTVARVKTNILGRSYVGGILTRNTGSVLGRDNRALGFDAGFNFYRYLSIQSFLSTTHSNELNGKDWAGRGVIEWASDRSQFRIDHLNIQENFRPEMGFVRRAEEGWKGLQQTQLDTAYRPRPRISWIRQFVISGSIDYLANQEGLLENRDMNAGFATNFQSGDSVRIDLSRNYERLVKPFRISGGGGTVAPGAYPFNRFHTQYSAYRGRRISGILQFERGGIYDGTFTSFSASSDARPSARISLAPSFVWNRIVRQGFAFITRELNTQLNYSLNQKWLTRGMLVWNSQDRNVLFNLRLDYIYRPGDDLFVVFNESHLYGDTSGLLNRSLIVKLTYSLDR
jgi:Domain of unknown function (DUF5916)/Carbohydrate family 9 binding domain-like